MVSDWSVRSVVDRPGFGSLSSHIKKLLKMLFPAFLLVIQARQRQHGEKADKSASGIFG